MKRFLLFLLVTQASCIERRHNDAQVSIRGGDRVEYGSFIDTVTTPVKGATRGSGVWIHRRILLTAAHVADGRRAVGVAWNDGSTLVAPGDVVVHPDFRIIGGGESSENDLAILFTDREADIPRPARLATHQGAIAAEKEITIAGYGAASLGGQASNRLQMLKMKIVPWNDTREIRSEHASRDAGACPGDSGGPAFVMGDAHLLLAGVMAHGDCEKGVLSSTSLVAFLPWIRAQLAARGYEVNPTTGEVRETTGPRPEPTEAPAPEPTQTPGSVGSNGPHKCLSTGYSYESRSECAGRCPHDMCVPLAGSHD